ncbi:MAG: enoyl-CoA hydratase-related protein [Planctomycetota bacterium]
MSPFDPTFPPDVPDAPALATLERRGEFVWLTLERPEARNALSFPLLKRVRGLVAEIARDLSIRAVLVTGRGEKAFSAGADLKERRGMSDDRARAHVAQIQALAADLAALPQPTIAAIHGVALGGGLELALACDLRVAAADAQLGLPETSRAILPGAGGTQRLPRLIGLARAKDLILTARRIDAAEAERIGLVDRVAPPGGLAAAATHLAEAIAANGPLAVRAAKAAIDGGFDLPLAAALEHERRCWERLLGTSDRLEALAAFAEKRPPRFEGR